MSIKESRNNNEIKSYGRGVLRAYRLETELSLEVVASLIAISAATLSLLENEKVYNPTNRTLWDIAELYAEFIESDSSTIFLNISRDIRNIQIINDPEQAQLRQKKIQKYKMPSSQKEDIRRLFG